MTTTDRLTNLLEAAADLVPDTNLMLAGDIVRHPVTGPAFIPGAHPAIDAEYVAALTAVGITLGDTVNVPGWGAGRRITV